jgi:predicted Zn finger-like uncharacterized protein
MRIACPSCATTYEVPETRLGPGKVVRCTRCGGEWVPIPEPSEAPPPPDPENTYGSAELAAEPSPLTAMDRLAAVPEPAPSRVALLGAWILSVLVLIGAAAAISAWRDPIDRAWPPLARILPPSTPHMMPQTAKTAGAKAE